LIAFAASRTIRTSGGIHAVSVANDWPSSCAENYLEPVNGYRKS
jgi:hypothetical protein